MLVVVLEMLVVVDVPDVVVLLTLVVVEDTDVVVLVKLVVVEDTEVVVLVMLVVVGVRVVVVLLTLLVVEDTVVVVVVGVVVGVVTSQPWNPLADQATVIALSVAAMKGHCPSGVVSPPPMQSISMPAAWVLSGPRNSVAAASNAFFTSTQMLTSIVPELPNVTSTSSTPRVSLHEMVPTYLPRCGQACNTSLMAFV